MTRSRLHVAASILAGAMFAGPPVVKACGFEDPSSADIARGGLNWSFPDALHVSSAVWQAELNGIVPRRNKPTVVDALLGRREIVRSLERLREELSGPKLANDVPTFSLVLIGPMLWSRFNRTGGLYIVEHHVPGPLAGDVVVVTDTPVIQAISQGILSVSAAEDAGLWRYYGAESRVTGLREVLRATSFRQHEPNDNAAALGG